MTFKEYLAGRKAGVDAAGDFVRVARCDPNFPAVVSLSEVLTYLGVEAGSEAARGAQVTWTKYQVAKRDAKRKMMRDA